MAIRVRVWQQYNKRTRHYIMKKLIIFLMLAATGLVTTWSQQALTGSKGASHQGINFVAMQGVSQQTNLITWDAGLILPKPPIRKPSLAAMLINNMGQRAQVNTDTQQVVYLNDIYTNRNIGDLTYADYQGGGVAWTYRNQNQFRHILGKPGSKWVVTPLVWLENNRVYTFNIYAYSSYTGTSAPIEIVAGSGDNPDEYTHVINGSLNTEMQGSVTYADRLSTFTLDEAGDYHVAFRVVEEPDAGSGSTFVRLISLTAGSLITAPDSVTDIHATAAPLGELKTTVSVTTPVTNIKGDELNSINQLRVYRGEDLIYTKDNPELGTEYTFEDENPANGFNTYTAICTNEDGDGPDKSTEVYVGVDAPDVPQNVKLYDIGDGKVQLRWEAPAGKNGGYVDPATVLYKVFKVKNNQGTLIADNVDAYQYDMDTTYTGTQPGDQVMVSMAVSAFTDMGSSALTAGVVVLGMPYPLPYNESFAEMSAETNMWTTQLDDGMYSFYNFTESSQDNNHGSVYMQYSSAGEVSSIFSPMIDISAAERPMLSFYYFAVPGQNVQTEVVVSKATLTEETLATIDHSTLTGSNGWRKVTVDLSNCTDARYVRIGFRTHMNELGTCMFDNIEVRDVSDYDLAVSLSAPYFAEPDEAFNFSATVSNVGANALTDEDVYVLKVYAGDQLIAIEEEADLAANEQQTFSYSYTVPTGQDKVANLRAEVTFGNDINSENNHAEFAVGINQVVPDTISDLTGETGNAVSLTWSNPKDICALITDSFEEYDDFSYDEIGDYTCINYLDPDEDLSRYVFVANYYPNIAAPFAFYIFNAHAEGYNQYANVASLQAHTGDKVLYTSSLADEGYEHSDSWIISPELSGNEQTIHFWARTWSAAYGLERIELLYSTSDTDKQSFTSLFDTEVPSNWTQYGAYLPAGTKYFAVRYRSIDKFILFMDDFTYHYGEREIEKYNVYRNGELIGTATEPTFVDDDGHIGDKYTVTVSFVDGTETGPSNVYIADGTTALRELYRDRATFTTTGEHSSIVIRGLNGRAVDVFNIAGAHIYHGTGNDVVTIPVNQGIYLVTSGSHTAKVIVR